jgi:hypothetical protein
MASKGMEINVDRRKTLTELEGQNWGPPTFGSHLVTTIHRLRYVPLEQFTIEDLRICIGQNLFLEFLLPIAVERLQDDPFVEGDYYAGDLLNSVLRIEQPFWKKHTVFRKTASEIAKRAFGRREEFADVDWEELDQGLQVFGMGQESEDR